MARALVIWRDGETQAERARPAPLSRRADFGTILCGQWLMLGLAIDGWAHHTRPNVESFFTPWHGLLYSGYAACAAWMIWLIAEQRRAGRIGRAAIPRGYELGVAGVVLFGLSGIGDLIWHETIGIEQNRKASLSPSHLLLFVGIILIVSSPFRAAWATDDAPHARPRLADFLPALLSLGGAAAITGAMHIWLWGFAYLADGRPATAMLPAAALAPTADLNLAMILVTTVLLLAPLLLLLRRWHPPFGSTTVIFGIVAGLLCAVTGFRQPLDVLVAVATGLCGDLAIGRFDPRPGRPWAYRGVAFGMPVLLWTLHFAQVGLREGIAWPPEYWTGITLLTGLLGLGLSVLLVPPTIPAHARDH